MGASHPDLPLPREPVSLREFDKRVVVAAEFLQGLDNGLSKYGVDGKGKITAGNVLAAPVAGDLFYSRAHQELLTKFAAGNRKCAEQFSVQKGVLDARVINGCVVVIYDSSKGLPPGFKMDEERGHFSDPTDFPITDEKRKAGHMYRLGLITIDMNPAKRLDGVSATTSLQHELSHYNLSVTDFILSQDPELEMRSGYRKGRNAALYGSARGRLTMEMAFLLDIDKYALLLSRSAKDILQSDVEAQLGYLGELHSSMLQRKDEWFNPTEKVYNNRGAKGKYWQVVGKHPTDAVSAKNLLKYIQAIYLSERLANLIVNQKAGERELLLKSNVTSLMNKASALIGASRTIEQARRLVETEWKKFTESELGKKLIDSKEFLKWRKEKVYPSGWQVEGLEELFQKTN